ncbi:hypothetical protein [Paenibacillus fonticola]|uniref:hypothetical protein n=1 Tax=Paenibacillus fonticola TaxID=379896 RepID=UPI000369A95D|nr:hypothetical protein [Paenibacillus fonticola]
MKAVPKVNADGLYIEDTIMDDAFSGVVPFYASPYEPEPMEPGQEHPEQPEQPEEEEEPEIAGYIVGVPVPPGLFRPRFDIAAWDKDISLEPAAYWKEGLTPKEIEQLTKQEEVITPERVLAAESVRRELEVLELKQQNAALGSQVVAQELTIKDLKSQYEALGKTMVTLELKLLGLTNKGGGDE